MKSYVEESEPLDFPVENLKNNEEDIYSILDELQDEDEIEIKIYRLGQGKKSAYLFTIDSADYSMGQIMEKVKEEYGSGDYRIDVRQNNKWLKKKTFSIQMPKNNKPEIPEKNNDIVSLITSMNENTQRQNEENKNQFNNLMFMLMKSQQDAAQRQTDMLLEMMRINAQKPEPRDNQLDIVSIMTLTKELFGDKKQDDPMKVFLQGVEFGRETGGNDDVLSTAIKTFGAPLVDMSKKMGDMDQQKLLEKFQNYLPEKNNFKTPEKLPEKQNVILSDKKVTSPTLPEADEMNFVVSKLLQKFDPQIKLLCQAAILNANIDPYIDIVLDTLDGYAIDIQKALSIVENDVYFEQWFHVLPMFNTPEIRDWMNDFRAALIGALRDSDNPEEENAEHVPREYEPAPFSDSPDTARDPTKNSGAEWSGTHNTTID